MGTCKASTSTMEAEWQTLTSTRWHSESQHTAPIPTLARYPQRNSDHGQLITRQSEGTHRLPEVRPPPAREQLATVLTLDVRRVLDRVPRPLRKRPADSRLTVHLHLEVRFLRHGRVEDVVGNQVRAEEGDVGRPGEAVGAGGVAGHPEDRVAVAKGDAGKVPEGELAVRELV
jgi:hypothetical protein